MNTTATPVVTKEHRLTMAARDMDCLSHEGFERIEAMVDGAIALLSSGHTVSVKLLLEAIKDTANLYDGHVERRAADVGATDASRLH